ncbi:MAG: PEP-CTERM sorting domain-containing protein [Puniceicoccaceae bacterium]|nr:MAG: PEP-CTERM sorting domain-containing protein [Puniceicoccaceae bacterium]
MRKKNAYLTFDEAVWNPVMLIVSLGRPNDEVKYTFNHDFTILSQGTGYWGGNSTSLQNIDGNILSGHEGHGAIQFSGWVSEISWTVDSYEYWHGFTVGMPDQPSVMPVPEPSTYGALGALLLVGLIAHRRWNTRKV